MQIGNGPFSTLRLGATALAHRLAKILILGEDVGETEKRLAGGPSPDPCNVQFPLRNN